ncbi:hypothetical protein EZV61_13850 [Corallincola luteus]|uniref:Uncharacterized protein n=1 Tax=Corallincola luteus TaxID=1775177 RepID=A0ABY2AIW3_9GAMM|nr:hypothetical protein [Corallincola luteus]TCI02436.1 hypothetical protein EZV61_13850 [Corallincola luteus]
MRIPNCLILLAAVSFIFGAVGCDSSGVAQSVKRLDEKLHEIEVTYISDTCDPYTVRLFLTNDEGKAVMESPILVALPVGLKAPRDSRYAVSGTTFTLKGYLYAHYSDQAGQRIDLVAWKPKSPYSYWSDEEPSEIKTGSDVVPWNEASTDTGNQSFKLQKYNSCL